MKITKKAYEILTPQARTYWMKNNKTDKFNDPESYRLRETLLANNNTMSNITLISMMASKVMPDKFNEDTIIKSRNDNTEVIFDSSNIGGTAV